MFATAAPPPVAAGARARHDHDAHQASTGQTISDQEVGEQGRRQAGHLPPEDQLLGYGATPPLKLDSGGLTAGGGGGRRFSRSAAPGLAAHALVQLGRRAAARRPGGQLRGAAAVSAAHPPRVRRRWSRIAAGASDGSIALLRLPARRYANAANAPAALAAHGQTLTSPHFSHSGRLLLAASADGSASVGT